MAVTLEELQIKFKSEIASATSKDAAALARVDAEVRKSAQNLDKLRAAHAGSAAAARAAEREQAIAGSQLRNARPEDRAKREAAARAANARAAKAAAAEEASAARLGGAAGQHKALVAAQPELVALAKRKQAVIDQSAAAKRAAAEQAAAAKKLEEQRKSAGEEVATKKIEAMQAATLGAAGAALTLTAAIGGAGIAAAGFGFKAADAARSARLLADALTGSKELGAEFDAVVTQLASKVPLARSQIADLARELSLMKLGRRDMQAGLTAIAITTSAIGDAAGGVIKGVVQSSAAMKRFTLGARDMWGEYTGLAGSGLKSMDVLSALAKQLGVGVGEVEKKLRLGQIKMKDGLRALEAATQARFGKTIAGQMLSINTQFSKAQENLAQMTSGVDLEPALNGLKELLSIFDESTAAGAVLKALIGEGLGGLSSGLGVLLPLGKAFFLEFAIGAMEIYLALRPIGRQIREWVGPFLTAENAATAGKVAVYALAATFGVLAVAAGAAVALLVLPFVVVGVAIWALVRGAQAAWTALGDGAKAAAAWIIDGLVGGIVNGASRVMSAARNLADSLSNSFKAALGIASPSKVFFRYGVNVDEGAEAGIEAGAGDVQGAVDDMAPVPPGGGSRSLARLGGSTVNVYVGDVYFGGRKATEEERGGLVEFLKQQLQAGINAGAAGEPVGVPA
jgi:hypothetical protein